MHQEEIRVRKRRLLGILGTVCILALVVIAMNFLVVDMVSVRRTFLNNVSQ